MMKIKELFTIEQGFFSLMNNDIWSSRFSSSDMDIEFLTNQGERNISPMVEYFVQNEQITIEDKRRIASIVYNKYQENWRRLFAILNANYVAWENYNMVERMNQNENTQERGDRNVTGTVTTNDKNKNSIDLNTKLKTDETHTRNLSDSSTNRDEMNGDITVRNTGTTELSKNLTTEQKDTGTDTTRNTGTTTDTKTGTNKSVTDKVGKDTKEDVIFGFGSDTGKNANKTVNNTTDKDTVTDTFNETYTKTQDTTEAVSYGKTETTNERGSETSTDDKTQRTTDNSTNTSNFEATYTGSETNKGLNENIQTGTNETIGEKKETNTQTNTTNETQERTFEQVLTRSGNIGVTTTQQMLTSEIELWKWNFLNQVYQDCITMIALDVY